MATPKPFIEALRTARLLVKARRNDLDVSRDDDQIADSTTVQVKYTAALFSLANGMLTNA